MHKALEEYKVFYSSDYSKWVCRVTL